MAANFAIVVNAKSIVAGQSFSITVSALDAEGMVMTDYAGIVHFSSSDVMAGLPDDYTFTGDDAGVHTFDGVTLFRAGAQWVRAVDTGTAVSGYTVVTVAPAPADHFRVTAISRVLSGTPFDITITALDPYGNVDFNYTGTVMFTSTDNDPNVVLPLAYTFTSDDAGIHTFTDTGRGETTLITVGDQTITVTDGTISLDIPVTVDQGGNGPGGFGSPGAGNGRFSGQPLADLVKEKTAEPGAGTAWGTSPVPLPNKPAMAFPDVIAEGSTDKKVKNLGHFVPRAASIVDRFFAENEIEAWWK
jgi:hypothetical protein